MRIPRFAQDDKGLPSNRDRKRRVSAHGDLPSVSDLLDLRAINATWHLGPCAEVRVGEHVTRYVRRGSGPSVVLLGADVAENALWEPVVESLRANHRLIIPQTSPECMDSIGCLRGFVEGIGLSGFALIAGGPTVVPALELATADDFTVRKLVLLPDDQSYPAPDSPRVLWVPRSVPTAKAVRDIEQFLRDG